MNFLNRQMQKFKVTFNFPLKMTTLKLMLQHLIFIFDFTVFFQVIVLICSRTLHAESRRYFCLLKIQNNTSRYNVNILLALFKCSIHDNYLFSVTHKTHRNSISIPTKYIITNSFVIFCICFMYVWDIVI